MSDAVLTVALTIAAIGAGLLAGVYFAFSAFIMRSFDQLGPVEATDAMNAINETILRSCFMALFFCSTILYAILCIWAVLDANLPGRWFVILTGLIYVFGMFVCTILFNKLSNPIRWCAGTVKDFVCIGAGNLVVAEAVDRPSIPKSVS